MKRFELYRHTLPEEHQGGSDPHEKVRAEGIVFSDGVVAVRWFDGRNMQATTIWDSFEAFEAIHITPHPTFGTKIVWLDN